MIRIAAFSLACVAALASGIWFSSWLQRETAVPEVQGFVLSEPRDFPAFTLTDDNRESFGPDDFRGKWSLLYFGFTYCPDICPLTLAVFRQFKAQLSESGRANTAFYLVSVDPERDTPERLHDYVRYFDPDFRALTGPVAELDKLARTAGVIYIIPDDTGNEDYLVDHSSTVTLVNPDGQVHAVFTAPHTANQLARDIGAVVSQW